MDAFPYKVNKFAHDDLKLNEIVLIYLMTRVAIVDATNKIPKIIVELNKIFSKPLLVW